MLMAIMALIIAGGQLAKNKPTIRERWSMIYKPKARKDRFCTECGTQLRRYYKSNETVCGQPKVTKNQSRCQLDRSSRLKLNNQAKDTTGRKCKICNEVMVYKQNANQELCNRPKDIRYLFIDHITPCQVINRRTVIGGWKKKRKKYPIEKTEEEKLYDEIDQKWLPELKLPLFDGKVRKCMGLLSADDELGDHWFKSAGPGNRICPKCVEAREIRKEAGAIADQSGRGIYHGVKEIYAE